MAILIDPPIWPAHGTQWSHLVSDADYDELHTFAQRLALPRRSFDLDHYDVPEVRYADAVALGALPVSGRELLHALQRSQLRVRQIDRVRIRRTRRIEYLRDEWLRLGVLLGTDQTDRSASRWAGLGQEVLVRWSEEHRRYHSVQHLEDVLLALDHLEHQRERIETPTLLAAWFHDAVYRGSATDERDSADLAAASLSAFSIDSDVVDEVHGLILATSPASEGAEDPTRFAPLHDADLWIFSSSATRYAQYSSEVRAEYAHVSDKDFRVGRARILETYLARPRLYLTGAAHAMWEERARGNVAAEIEVLRSRTRTVIS